MNILVSCNDNANIEPLSNRTAVMIMRRLRSHAMWRPSPRVRSWLAIGTVLSTLFISALAHRSAGLTLPLPWNDETTFLWPAIHFAQQNTLLSPELNADRPLMWMPPGYMLILGLIFKIIPFSFVFVRWLSWGFMALAYVMLILWMRRYRSFWAALLFLSLFWLNSTFACAGNVARMDGLLLLLVTAGYLLCAHQAFWKGLPLLACSLLVHPNGIYFFGAALVAVLLQSAPWRRPTQSEKGLIVLAILAWVAYGLYVHLNWEGFQNDMAMQFSRKKDWNPLALLLRWPTCGYMTLYAMIGLVASVKFRRYLLPIAFGFSSYFISVTGHEMWYLFFLQLGMLVLGWLTIAAADRLVQKRWRHPSIRYASGALLGVVFLCFFYLDGMVEGPRGYFRELAWGWGMHTESEVKYFTEQDRTSIWKAIQDRLPSGSAGIKVQFIPSADQFLYFDMFGPKIQPFTPHFTVQKPDMWVVHESRYIPPWVAKASEHIQPRSHLLYTRDETERWYWVAPAENIGAPEKAGASNVSAR